MLRILVCPLCGDERSYLVHGYDRKAGPGVFEFLEVPDRMSHWSVCRGCGFLFQNPRPSPEKILDLYTTGLYRAKREYTDEFFKARYTRPIEHFKWFRSHVPGNSELRVLDIGAGHGGAVRAFRDLGADADGIEVDRELSEIAKQRFNVNLMEGDFQTRDFPDASYDLIYSSHTHEHFDDFLAVNKKIHRILRPGGHLLLVLPTYRFAGRNGQGFINIFHNSIFTATSLRNMLVLSGFEPITFRYPFDHSRAEIWGIGQRVESVEQSLLYDRAWLVYWEVRLAPGMFESLYRIIDRVYRTRIGRRTLQTLKALR